MKRLLSILNKVVHPLVAWVAMIVSVAWNFHYSDQIYWKTPSIPFQPFCSPKAEYEDFRPLKGVEMSNAYLKEVINAMSHRNLTVRLQYGGWLFVGVENPILVTPETWNDSTLMIHLTDDAYDAVRGIQLIRDPKTNEPSASPDRAGLKHCEDIEGVIAEF